MRSGTNTQSDASGGNQLAFTDGALAGWEIASVVSSILIAEWMAASAGGFTEAIITIPVVLAIVVIIVSHRLRNESLRDVGFRFDNFLRALYVLTVPVVATAMLCLFAGWKSGTPVNFLRWHPDRYLALQFAVGFCWALAQQSVLQGFVNRRAMILAGQGWVSILLVATIFGLLHLPNIWITVITFGGGVIWAAVYQRVPNLFALAITHSVMTWFIVSTLPPAALHHLRVGLGYFF